jgi:Ca-activated chloride channel family protein
VAPVTGGNAAIAALYGRERVADLESRAAIDRVDDQIEQLGVDFQIATRMTSWIAIDHASRVTGNVRDENIPQELPYGTSMASFGLRGGAPIAMDMLVGSAMPQMMQMQAPYKTMAGIAPQSMGYPGAGAPQSRAGGYELEKREADTGAFDRPASLSVPLPPEPLVRKQRTYLVRPWLALIAILALLALLIWWLVR